MTKIKEREKKKMLNGTRSIRAFAMQFYCAEPRLVLDALAQNRADPFAVRRTCVELSRLLLAQPASHTMLMAHPELLPTVVAAVEVHADADALVLADCCRFLRRTINLRGARCCGCMADDASTRVWLTDVPAPSELDVQSRIVETGVLKLLASGLARHAHSAPLFGEACRLVALLCFDMPFAPHGKHSGAASEPTSSLIDRVPTHCFDAIMNPVPLARLVCSAYRTNCAISAPKLADNQADVCDTGLQREICECLRSNDAHVSTDQLQLGVDAIAAVLYENGAELKLHYAHVNTRASDAHWTWMAIPRAHC